MSNRQSWLVVSPDTFTFQFFATPLAKEFQFHTVNQRLAFVASTLVPDVGCFNDVAGLGLVQPVGDHLQVAIPELGWVLETAPGKPRRNGTVFLALSAIRAYLHKQVEAAQAKGLLGSMYIFRAWFPSSTSVQSRLFQTRTSSVNVAVVWIFWGHSKLGVKLGVKMLMYQFDKVS